MNTETLETLVRCNQAGIYRYLRYLGANPVDAQDLVQESFLAAFQANRQPDPGDARASAAWLRGVARNMFLRHCARQKRSKLVVNSDQLEKAEAAWARDFLRDGDGFETMEALRKCIKKLTAKQRNVLDMRYSERKSRDKMSSLLEMTNDGVKSLLRRIRSALGECIKSRLAEGSA